MGSALLFTSAALAPAVAALALAGCVATTGRPLLFAQAAEPQTRTSVFIPHIGSCSAPTRGAIIDPSRPLIVLVHGCNSPPGQFASLAGAFEARGQQAVCFRYDDRERLEVSAARLVTALEFLKARLTSRHIVVLGHSQGGLIARRALVRDRTQGLRDDDGFRYELVTVSSPFHGIDASADCGSTFLRVITLGVTVGVCRIVAGAMWKEIYPRSSFMRRPGTLLASVERHVKVVTDERSSCRRRDLAGHCLKSDFVFSLAEQYAPSIDDDTRAQSTQIRAGHVEIVGRAGNPPEKLIQLLQEEQILSAHVMDDHGVVVGAASPE